MRKINDMFHVDNEGHLVKTSNGAIVPSDEPLFILRGRDDLAAVTILYYSMLMEDTHCDKERIEAVEAVVEEFREFKKLHPDRMKQPGVTKGK